MKTNKKILSIALCLIFALNIFAANVTQTVTQVTEAVTLSNDVDYVITGDEPFTATGSVDIVNMDHAVVIIKKIKPSKVIANWLNYIKINGEKATDNVNCQVKMYDTGAIIFPYDKNIRPLTCYTERNFGGTSYSEYTEGHSGGYMKTLTAANLNNQIQSFKLKRGYMVTFALGTGGWGYSRCFIADRADLEMNLPINMAGRVSSYRIFKWQNAHKSGVASTEDAALMSRLDGSWCYGWAVGRSMLPDYENVPNHIYEDYPSSSACGQTTASCHLKTNNEPGNPADDTPQTVEQVLDNWQSLMRTGLRLASETSHDGSMGHLRAFIDSVDARGWRCDLLDLHCYWASGFSNMQHYYTSYGNRPIWISEWVWGASWNNNGIFSAAPDGRDSFSEANQRANYNGTVPILQALNASKYVERYAYWNWERNCSKLDLNGTLSLLGEYYANMDAGLAYNASLEKVPNVVYRAPSNLSSKFNDEKRTLQLIWNDVNGDMLDSMAVFCKRPGSLQYEYLTSIALKDMNAKNGASYTYTDSPANGTNSYRIAIYPIGIKTPKFSNTVNQLVLSQKIIWNDVTDTYVVNAGFDDEADFQTTGLTNGANNHKSAKGWTTLNTDPNGASAVFKIGSPFALNGRISPAKDAQGNVSGGSLGMNQGWNQESSYTQQITLPAGTYRISYAVYNVANAVSFTNLCGYRIGAQAAVYDNISSISTGAWRVSSLTPFTLTEETNVTLSLGYISSGGTSTSNPYLYFDYIMIEEGDMSNVDDAGDEIIWLDATDYIRNPGFDVETDFITTNLGTGKTNHKNATSWTTTCTDEWGCGGAFKVGGGITLNGQKVPTLNADGKATGGVIGISQGWGIDNFYTQIVTLPAGAYRFSYAVYNAANPSASFTSRCGYKIGANAAVYDGLPSLSTSTWHFRTMEEFTISTESKVTLSVGFKAGDNTSTTNPFLFFDFVKLEKGILKSSIDTGDIVPSMNDNLQPSRIFNLNGIQIPALQKGINIVQYTDGSVKKIFVQ